MSPFRDKVALVTGGASGIGRALGEEMGRGGAQVILADLNEPGAQQAASAINEKGGRARAARLDVTSAEDFRRLVDETVARHGRLDYLFNNAGIAIGGEEYDLSLEHWRRVVDVNLWGVVHGIKAAYLVMVKQGYGHIVNTASLAGLLGYPTNNPYAATKHAVVGLSASLRAEAADLGVKVSVICPGYVQTGIFDASLLLNTDKEKLLARIPFKPIAAEDAARTILRGVARNQGIIIFPFYARVLWWLNRLHPALSAPLYRRTVSEFRASRIDS